MHRQDGGHEEYSCFASSLLHQTCSDAMLCPAPFLTTDHSAARTLHYYKPLLPPLSHHAFLLVFYTVYLLVSQPWKKVP